MAKNPVEEFLTEKRAFGLSKLRSVGAKAGPAFARAGEQAGNAALAGAGAAAFAGLAGAAGKLYDAATKSRDFNNMLEANPDLHEHLQTDPAGFNRLFTSMRRFSPEFTRDPLVAGTLMRQGMDTPIETRGNLVIRGIRDQPQPKQGPAAEAAIGGFMKGFGGAGGDKKPQLLRQTKTVSRLGEDGATAPDRIEESQNYYG